MGSRCCRATAPGDSRGPRLRRGGAHRARLVRLAVGQRNGPSRPPQREPAARVGLNHAALGHRCCGGRRRCQGASGPTGSAWAVRAFSRPFLAATPARGSFPRGRAQNTGSCNAWRAAEPATLALVRVQFAHWQSQRGGAAKPLAAGSIARVGVGVTAERGGRRTSQFTSPLSPGSLHGSRQLAPSITQLGPIERTHGPSNTHQRLAACFSRQLPPLPPPRSRAPQRTQLACPPLSRFAPQRRQSARCPQVRGMGAWEGAGPGLTCWGAPAAPPAGP